MIPQATPEPLLLKTQPVLRHPRYREAYEAGRLVRLTLELSGKDTSEVPLYSHHGTYQAVFKRGWLSVSEQDIRLHRDTTAGIGRSHVSFA